MAGMADYMRDELTKLLDDYDTRRRGEAAREQQAKDDEARFLADFAELRRAVIRPVFEAAGALLEERGHRWSIAEQEFVAGTGARIGEASITLRIVPSGTKAPLHEDQRSLSVSTRHYNKTLWIHSGESQAPGGLAGGKDAYPLEKVTRQLVEEQLIAFVARVVAS
jgi:hypothetical protein